MGGDRAPPRGRRLRGRAGRAGLPLLRHARASSGSTAESRRRSSGRSRRSGPAGTPARAPPTGASPRSPPPRSRGRGRRSSSPTTQRERVPRAAAADALPARGRTGARSSSDLGVKKIGQLAGLPGAAVAERLGPDGRRAWSLARRRGRRAKVEARGRRRGDRRAARVPRGGRRTSSRSGARFGGTARPDPRAPRARRAGDPQGRALGAARRRRLVASHGDAARADARSGACCGRRSGRSSQSSPRPVLALGLELLALVGVDRQPARADPAGRRRAGRAVSGKACARCVRARARARSATVVEVAPWSRIPEQRALLVPARLNAAAAGARRGTLRRVAAAGESPGRSRSSARSGASSTAGGRRSRSPPLLRGRARERPERRRLPRRGTGRVVLAARCLIWRTWTPRA